MSEPLTSSECAGGSAGQRAGAVLITDAPMLDAARSAWEALEPDAYGPIEHFEWSRACVDAMAGLGRLQMVSIWDDGRCCALAPLAARARTGFRLESICVKELTEPMDFVYRDRDALARLCEELARRGRPIELPRVTADSPVVEELRRAFRDRGMVHVGPSSPYPFLEIDSTWSNPESHFNSGRRSDFRRALRHAEQTGPTRFEVVTPLPANLQELLGEAYDVEVQGWKGRNGTALALDPLRAGFYRRYFQSCCDKGILRIAFMRVADKAVGMQLAVETKRRLWLHKIGHNEEFSRSSPGTLLMLQVARYAAEQGLQSIEFLGSAEPWTRIWTERLRPCVRIRAYPRSFSSVIPFGLDAAAWAAARIRRRFVRDKAS